MTVSDIASGVILIVLAFAVLYLRSGWANYGNGFVGLWLLLAPLIFWAPQCGRNSRKTSTVNLLGSSTLTACVPTDATSGLPLDQISRASAKLANFAAVPAVVTSSTMSASE